MKLYVFEACPFCIRARIMAGWQELSPQIIPVTLGEFPKHLSGRVPQKTVPVLVDGDLAIQDSAEIVRYLDQKGHPLLKNYQLSADFEKLQAELFVPINALCYPRLPHLGVAELASPEARDLFETTIPRRIGMSFLDALAQTDLFISQVTERLPSLMNYVCADTPTFDSIVALAMVHNLSMVAEFTLPDNVVREVSLRTPHETLPVYAKIDKHGGQ